MIIELAAPRRVLRGASGRMAALACNRCRLGELQSDGRKEFEVLEDEVFEIYSQPESFASFREELDKREVPLITKELAMLPQNLISVDPDKVPQLLRLLEALEDQEDVQNVWANFDIDTDVLAAQLA